MRFRRIENPSSTDVIQVASLLESDVDTVVLQFSKAASYNEKTLSAVNTMCKRFGSRLNVRFYGHYGSEFDCLTLRYLQLIRSPHIDCLMNAAHLEFLDELIWLEEFAFGVFRANVPRLLKSRALIRLRNKLSLVSLLFVVLITSSSIDIAQTPSSALSAQGAQTSDPLRIGKSALQHGDYASAKEFFKNYVAENPSDSDGWLYLGGSELDLHDRTDAIKDLQKAINLKPENWLAHQNLALAYAETEEWSNFDKERALIKAARAEKKQGVSAMNHDLIDIFAVNGKTYQVWFFPDLYGQYHVRYAFLHFASTGKPDSWVQCESDDVDQVFFKQSHPKEAAAGDRSFSLDIYSQTEKGMRQTLVKFYQEGEPTYETVRADVLKTLQGKEQPAATTTMPAK